jgi:hypothetical protein
MRWYREVISTFLRNQQKKIKDEKSEVGACRRSHAKIEKTVRFHVRKSDRAKKKNDTHITWNTIFFFLYTSITCFVSSQKSTKKYILKPYIY